MRTHFTLLLLTIFLASCQDSIKDIEFKTINNMDVKNWSMDNVIVGANVTLYNPNPVSVKLEKFEFDIFLNDRNVAKVNQDVAVDMKAEQNFVSQVVFSFSPTKELKKFNMSPLEIGMELLTNKEVRFKYSGFAKISKGGLKIDVPIEEVIVMGK